MVSGPVRGKGRQTVAVEWIYIRYRTVLLLAGSVLLAAALALFWWAGGLSGRSEAAAVGAVSSAGQKVQQAAETAPQAARLPEARERLEAARATLARSAWDQARDEALAAEAIATTILSGHGAGGGTSVAISRASGDVRLKRAGKFLWETAVPGDELRTGDQLRTGTGQSSAQLLYFDGTTMTVSPGTLLEIRELHRDPARRTQRVSERLAFGRLSAETRENAGFESVHEVATDSAAIRARQAAEFQVRHDQDGRSEVVATRGELAVASGDQETALPAATRVMLAAGGAIVARSRLLDPPLLASPADASAIVGANAARVLLAWGAVDRAAGYQVQVGERPLFAPGEGATVTKETNLELRGLAPGTHFWRVAARDTEGREGLWSESRKFRVVGEEFRDPSDRAPPGLDVSEIMVVGTNAIVSGRVEPGALVWVDGERVDVEDDGRFTWIVKLRADGENKIRFVAQDAAGNETKRLGTAWLDVF